MIQVSGRKKKSRIFSRINIPVKVSPGGVLDNAGILNYFGEDILMKMRALLLFCFSFSSLLVWGQQPFNYGQNREVYFISSEVRKKWGIEKVYLARQEKEEKTNLLYSCSFTSTQVITRTYIRYDERSFRYQLDSMLQKKYDIQNTYYFHLEKGKIKAFGSEGNGVNDQHEVKRSSGSSVVESIKAGGGVEPRLNYTRNIFSTSGRLLYGVY
jgi:hypothetical protein